MSIEGYLADLTFERVPIDTLVPHPRNYRIGDIDIIAKSLVQNTMYSPLLVRKETREILKGNHTFKAAQKVGLTEVWVAFIDVDDQKALDILVADNTASDRARNDHDLLLALLKERLESSGNVDAMLYDREDVLDMIKETRGIQTNDDPGPPSLDEASQDVRAQLGDVWAIGEDCILVCGDSTTDAPYEAAKRHTEWNPVCVWTDPPYGVDYEGKTKAKKRIKNDGASGLLDLVVGAFNALDRYIPEGASIYVAHPAGRNASVFGEEFEKRWLFHQPLIWVKSTFALGHSDYHFRHEPIIYGWKRGADRKWVGGRDKSTILEFPKPPRSEDHPTMKPVELIEAMISNSAERGDLIVDPFGGSGSTGVAALKQGMRVVLFELDPVYCEVILRRVGEVAGSEPMLLERVEE